MRAVAEELVAIRKSELSSGLRGFGVPNTKEGPG